MNVKSNYLKRFKGRGFFLLVLTLWLGGSTCATVHAWRWDEDENSNQDECDIELQAYHKRVESGIGMQERVVSLDRLIKLCQLHHRDTKSMEAERTQLVSDENAILTVGAASRAKSQELFQKAFEQIRAGTYRDAQASLMEAEHLNPSDKMVTDLRQKIDAVVTITPEAPTDPATADLMRKGITEFLSNEPSKALNYLVYAMQKSPSDKTLPNLVDLVKHTYPGEASEMLDARLNLIDQKLQRALEKIYSGEYLDAAKECQEVLDLEPENSLALTRLGSVYYAMGQVKQARTYWERALTLDPKNDVLRSFLQQSEAETDRAPAQELTYKVEKGDTLIKISEKIYKNPNAWRKLYDANRAYMKNPYALAEGQVLVVPPATKVP